MAVGRGVLAGARARARLRDANRGRRVHSGPGSAPSRVDHAAARDRGLGDPVSPRDAGALPGTVSREADVHRESGDGEKWAFKEGDVFYQYKILRLLGAGLHGEVYLIEHR